MADELLTAYVDGVSELDPAERERLEERLQGDPALRAEAEDTRELLGQLRALPQDGVDPDWVQLEGAIRAAVGPGVPRPWWQRWQRLAPIFALATTAAIAVVWLHHPQVTRHEPAPVAPLAAEPPPSATVWIDDQVVDVGELDADVVLDGLDPETVGPESDTVAADVTGGILPAASLDWVDQLDDGAIDRAERWLDRKKS